MTTFRGFYARVIRRGRQPLHIAEIERGRFGVQSRHGTALCSVYVQLLPESGDQGKPENATCPTCLRRWRGRRQIPSDWRSEGRA